MTDVVQTFKTKWFKLIVVPFRESHPDQHPSTVPKMNPPFISKKVSCVHSSVHKFIQEVLKSRISYKAQEKRTWLKENIEKINDT